MSYIINSNTPFASIKLTQKGREKLSKGQLTFNSWGIGDSEINYNREILVDDEILSNVSKILRPSDNQPDLRYFIHTGNSESPLNVFGAEDIKCLKVTIDNEADERGYFNGDMESGFTTDTSLTAFTKTYGELSGITISGGTELDIPGVEENDIILLKLGYSGLTNETPTPHLWYKAQSVVSGTVTVDRGLPNLSGGSVVYIVYNPGEIHENEPEAISYWDTGTLSFDSSCDITVKDVPVWNMNNVFSESVIGTTGTTEYEKFINYGSHDYLGLKNNYLYNSEDIYTKSIGVIHYTNKTISNLYGEFLFIDTTGKTVKIHLPDLMYHRRTFSGSTTGDKMGMTFIANGANIPVTESKVDQPISSESQSLTYIDLIEDPSLVNGDSLVVGRVYPELKIIVIDDDEILAALSYKSNRNWTLPPLELDAVGGVGTGSLLGGETMYVTYAIDNNSGDGITSSLPCQNFTKITNTNRSPVNVQFHLDDINHLPYMRNNISDDGFYGDTFKILYQITGPNSETRPTPDAWKEIDYTTSVLSGGTFINATLLESKNPNSVTPIFEITSNEISGSTDYSVIDTLSMPPQYAPDFLQFGDERFFYGNVESYIGAVIFKTLFRVNINANNFNKTTNTSRSSDPGTNPPPIKVSEVGIYDNDGDLVIISKLSEPIKLTSGSTVMIELSIDF